MDKMKKLSILVLLKTFFLLFEQGSPYFHICTEPHKLCNCPWQGFYVYVASFQKLSMLPSLDPREDLGPLLSPSS